jgi:copper resistance protein B
VTWSLRGLCVVLLLPGWVQAQPPPAAQHEHQEPVDEQGQDEPRTPIPPVTEAALEAAFPDVVPHPMPDEALNYFVLLDQLEGVDTPTGAGLRWDATAWVGGDINRVWLRTEGGAEDGRVGEAEAHLLYGRAVARWWDVVVGARQDVRPGSGQTWLAFGVQGLAPYWFEIEATAFVGGGGRTAARLEAEYDLLITNRLVLQPLAEVNLFGKTDEVRGRGTGLSNLETGLRLRYEIKREIAPYVGVVWSKTFGDTTDLARLAGDTAQGSRVVAGVRLWY